VEKKVKEAPKILKIRWESSLLKSLNLRSILKLDLIKSFLPHDHRHIMDDVVICNLLRRPIGDAVFNYKPLAKALPPLPVPSEHCPCRHMNARYRPEEGCVLTGDLTLIDNKPLRQLLFYGPKFRDTDMSAPLELLKDALTGFIAKVCSDNLDPLIFLAWKIEVLNEAKSRLEAQSQPMTKSLLANARPSLRHYQKSYVFCPADKAAGNIIIVCRNLYVHVLRTELTRLDSAYVMAQQSKDEILERHRKFLAGFNLPFVNCLPFLFWLPKLHKSPWGSRFMAACGKCSTTIASKILSMALKLVLDELRIKDNVTLAETGIRRFFIVQNYPEVSEFLARWNRGPFRKLSAFDFSTMYTTIPIDTQVGNDTNTQGTTAPVDLCSRIDSCIDEAVAARPEPKHSWHFEVCCRGGGVSSLDWFDCKRVSHRK